MVAERSSSSDKAKHRRKNRFATKWRTAFFAKRRLIRTPARTNEARQRKPQSKRTDGLIAQAVRARA